MDLTRVDAVAEARMILSDYRASEFGTMRGDGTVNGFSALGSDLEPSPTSSRAVEAFRVRHGAGIDRRFHAEAACIIQDISVLVMCIVALIIFAAVAIGGQF